MISEAIRKNITAVFQPRFFTLVKQRKSYTRDAFKADLVAGIVVGIVAIPLGIAFSSAAGLSPEKGLITCIIAALVVALLGGSHIQIAGPTGAFIIIIETIVAQYGFTGLVIATIIAGVILALIGVLKLGTFVKFIPYPITVGLISGIAVTIFTSQIKDFLGINVAKMPIGFVDKWTFFFHNTELINWWAPALGLLTVFIVILFPRITKRIPVYLVAIIAITGVHLVLNYFFGIQVETIGSKFPELAGGAPLPSPETPSITVDTVRQLIQPAFTIAMLSAIQATLSAVVADGVTGKRHHPNTEFIAQGAANIITPLFGGIPSTGAIARTMANVNNGGKTPVAAIIHSLFLLLVLVFMMPLAIHIPLPCLAGIVIMAAYNMSEWRSFKALLSNPRADVAVMLATFFLTLLFDLNIAIEIGLLMAVILFFKRVTDTSGISIIRNEIHNTEREEEITTEVLNIPRHTEVYEIDGPFFFGMANKFDEIDSQTAKPPKVRIIRMRKVPFIDSTGLHNLRNLWKRSQKEKIQLILSGVNNEVRQTLEKSGFASELGSEFICSNINEAVEKAIHIVS